MLFESNRIEWSGSGRDLRSQQPLYTFKAHLLQTISWSHPVRQKSFLAHRSADVTRPSMPTDFQCESCNLVVQSGWFHYHSYDKYWAATLSFCETCGTIHMLQHSTDKSSPDLMLAQPEPISIAESRFKGIHYSVPLQDWIERGESRSCGHCEARTGIHFGEMSNTLSPNSCPRCGAVPMKRLNSWIT